MTIKEPLLYKQKPLFGFDVGHGSIKVVQTALKHGKPAVHGYGATYFDRDALQNGEIIDFEAVAKATKELFSHKLVGEITTRSVAASLPATSTYTRVITLPKLDKKDLASAVQAEAEQYIPISPDNLYLDFETVTEHDESLDILIAATPRNVVDSYLTLFSILDLEPAILEPSILSVTRLSRRNEAADVPTVIVDMGSVTTDLIVYNDRNIQVTGTVKFGGLALTEKIKNALGVSEEQANIIKTKYGIQKSKKQTEILDAIKPEMTNLVSEVRKVIRYHEERNSDKSNKVEQIAILGGGANLPGIADFLTDSLRLPTHLSNSWGDISFGSLQPPHSSQATMFATATGLALIHPKDLVL